MRNQRFDRRLKSWWRSVEDHNMTPWEDSMDVDTQPLPVEEGFLDFDAPDYRPLDVTVPKRTRESVLLDLMRAVEDERKGLH